MNKLLEAEIEAFLEAETARKRFVHALARDTRYRALLDGAGPFIRSPEDLRRFAELVRETLREQ